MRFDGFTNSWDQCELGDIFSEYSKKSSVENEKPIFSSTNKGIEVRVGRVSGTSNVGYKIIDNGDLVLSPQNLWLGNININTAGAGLVSPSYKTFKITGAQSSFINPQLRRPQMLFAYKNASTQGASIVRRNLDMDAFNKISIRIPSEPEQILIGQLFKNLDNATVLHQRKLSQLKKLEQSFLQKLFV
ncbi:restriction endonuclease subunit S [Lacticaseibacillus pantheris]